MLMKENYEFLKLLGEKNPGCTIRVNTNLSTTETGIFELLCSFKNVHWTVSVESMEAEYNYIRYHGNWTQFLENLDVICKLNHKVSFNMLHFILNYKSIHQCVEFLKSRGFHDNSFIIGPLYSPTHLNTLNLPRPMMEDVLQTLRDKCGKNPTGYLKNSYENLYTYYTSTNWQQDLDSFYKSMKAMDERRGVDSRKIFSKLYEELNVNTLE